MSNEFYSQIEAGYQANINTVNPFQTLSAKERGSFLGSTFDEEWEPVFQVDDQVLISTFNLQKTQESSKFKDSSVGPFLVAKLRRPNAVKVSLTG